MPRPKKPARLWQRADGSWIILDAGRHHRTGYSGASGREAAEIELQKYLATKIPERSGRVQPQQILIGEILAKYAIEVGPNVQGKTTLAVCISSLADFWGNMTCDAVKGPTCRAYIQSCPHENSTIRRRLGVLQSALNHAEKEGLLQSAPRVTLPPPGEDRDRYLTRDEVAKLLRASPRHLQKFILISVYTGTRSAAVLNLRWQPSPNSGWVDLSRGIIHRKGRRELETKKRRGSVAAPRQLIAHMRRWENSDDSHVIMWKGAPLLRIIKSFKKSAARAGLIDVRPHDLKRTAVTWFFQRGGTIEDASEYFDTTSKTLEKAYRAHSPDHQSRPRAIMEMR